MTDPHSMQKMLAKSFERKSEKMDVSNLAQDQIRSDSDDACRDAIVNMGEMKQKLEEKLATSQAPETDTEIAEKKVHPWVIAAAIFALAAGLVSLEYLGSNGAPI